MNVFEKKFLTSMGKIYWYSGTTWEEEVSTLYLETIKFLDKIEVTPDK